MSAASSPARASLAADRTDRSDAKGDFYYLGPMGHIIWLCRNKQWYADK
ncbi:MAG: hypothetical protein JWP63_5647 [Candidatus Solibacter sp.]|nr:hypothetical protein [Candidatus Solibacter sp.]